MKPIFLIIVFFVHGEPVFLDGWLPREAPSMEVCEVRAERAREYLRRIVASDIPYPRRVFCATEMPPAIAPGGRLVIR